MGFRRYVGTAAQRAASALTGSAGDLFYDTDTKVMGVADGSTPLKNLSPWLTQAAADAAYATRIPRTVVATLDSSYAGSAAAAYVVPDNTELAILTLTASPYITLPTATVGRSLVLSLIQDTTGTRTVKWPTNIAWASGVAPTLTTTGGQKDTIVFLCTTAGLWDGAPGGQNIRTS